MPTLLDIGGWTTGANKMFEQAGGLASGVKSLFSGKTKAERQAVKDAQTAQKEALNKAELASLGKTTKKLEVWTWVQTNWLYLTIGGGVLLIIILWRPLMRLFNIKKKPSRSRPGRVKFVSKSKTRVTRSKVNKGFKRKIHGKTYTSAKSWAHAMRELRRKK